MKHSNISFSSFIHVKSVINSLWWFKYSPINQKANELTVSPFTLNDLYCMMCVNKLMLANHQVWHPSKSFMLHSGKNLDLPYWKCSSKLSKKDASIKMQTQLLLDFLTQKKIHAQIIVLCFYLMEILKLYSKVLAQHFGSALCTLVHPDQLGFVKQWFATENLRRLLHVTDAASKLSSPVLSVNTEKVFDRSEYILYGIQLENGIWKYQNMGPDRKILLFTLSLEPLTQKLRKSQEVDNVDNVPQYLSVALNIIH